MNRPVHLISLGAGVQSSTMALMAAHGEITPMPLAAIFADTQDEPASVYDWLGYMRNKLPFPVHVVTAGKLSDKELRIVRSKKTGKTYRKSGVPCFTTGPANGMLQRKCTIDFKVDPLTKKIREIADIKRRQKHVSVCTWMGISLDEFSRIKPSAFAWNQHRWPLIEKRMTRRDCLTWMGANGYPEPPRSACVFCPYHSNKEWQRLKTQEPAEFQKAVEFERAIQEAETRNEQSRSTPFLHALRKSLDTIDFRSDVERGQKLLDGFMDDCEGMCGV